MYVGRIFISRVGLVVCRDLLIRLIRAVVQFVPCFILSILCNIMSLCSCLHIPCILLATFLILSYTYSYKFIRLYVNLDFHLLGS